MKAAILGKKIGMTRVFDENGRSVPATIVLAGPCPILQVRTPDRDGYSAVQLGFEKRRPSRSTLPAIGHARKSGNVPQQFVREIRLTGDSEKQAGEVVTVEMFEEQAVKFVDIIGTTIGKGFQGVMKRHHFAGQEASHGVERKHRSAGSIGGSGDRGRGRCIKKGKRMPGHMGHVRCTMRNQRLLAIDKERNLLVIKGGVPGPTGAFLVVSKAKTKG